MEKVNFFIPAAGLGSRLYSLTEDKPKALVEVQGKPMINYILDKAIKLNVSEIIVNVHHFSEKMKEYLNANYPKVLISDETDKLLNTGGGLKKALNILKTKNNYPTIVCNVDIKTNYNFSKLVKLASEITSNINNYNDVLAFLIVSNRKSSRYLHFNKNMELIGWENVNTKEVIKAKEEGVCYKLAYSGIQLVNNKILCCFSKDDEFPLIPEYLKLSENHTIIGIEVKDTFLDLGKYDDLIKLNKNTI
ncbi:MAG: sugar phosphate nucleotidyltransferase [Bacteroidales bacterium]|jgi:MurNAc alpha-1-phosphate uridylyltransferase